MSTVEKASCRLRGRNPDVLTCIANLSNDEVFTPPEFANRMLDTLTEAWASAHGGADIWADPTVRFLDPCTKSGVFLREITSRLTKGLAGKIPDLSERVEHILTKQVYGIGITQLTSLLARRSLYCSKHAKGKHSIAKGFARDEGNIWFKRTEHTWVDGRCRYCSAGQSTFDRGAEQESHAYAFIHTDDITAWLAKRFGGNMQFDVIIGNPPYQMAGGAGGTSDSSIYHLFVEQALQLEPRFLSMVIPSRWLAGGRGMDEFRKAMLSSKHISHLVDHTQMSTAFPGVDFEGGVGYFLWGRDHQGPCEYSLTLGDAVHPPVTRNLDEFDIFVRDSRALSILNKCRGASAGSLSDLVSGDTPFGLATNFSDFTDAARRGDLALHYSRRGSRMVAYVSRQHVSRGENLVRKWKLLVPEAFGERGATPAKVLGPPLVAAPNEVCTQTYLAVGPFTSRQAVESCKSYYLTRLFRFLVSLRKITQHALRSTYLWVPMQTWDRTWTDAALYKKYGITKDEIAFIESMIRPMGDADA